MAEVQYLNNGTWTVLNNNSSIFAARAEIAKSAEKWSNTRNISLTGNVNGFVDGVDGSSNISISTTIADNAIITSKIRDNAVTTSKIEDGAVTTPKIEDRAVTTSKIDNNAITASKIEDKAVVVSKIDDKAISLAKLADAVQTVYVGATQPTDSHVTIWIQP